MNDYDSFREFDDDNNIFNKNYKSVSEEKKINMNNK